MVRQLAIEEVANYCPCRQLHIDNATTLQEAPLAAYLRQEVFRRLPLANTVKLEQLLVFDPGEEGLYWPDRIGEVLDAHS